MYDTTGLQVPGSVLENVQERRIPFPHFVARDVFDPALADAAYEWLSTQAPWHRHTHTFFDQFELSLVRTELPPLLYDGLVAPPVLRGLRHRMEALFGVSLADAFSVSAHRMESGQGVGVHTDRPRPGRETHRMVVHLGRGFDDSQGGHLIFFNSRDRRDVACAFRSVHNTAVGLELSERSYHAVAEVMAGTRYTLVYAFWPAGYTEGVKRPAAVIEGDRLVIVPRKPRKRRARKQ